MTVKDSACQPEQATAFTLKEEQCCRTKAIHTLLLAQPVPGRRSSTGSKEWVSRRCVTCQMNDWRSSHRLFPGVEALHVLLCNAMPRGRQLTELVSG